MAPLVMIVVEVKSAEMRNGIGLNKRKEKLWLREPIS